MPESAAIGAEESTNQSVFRLSLKDFRGFARLDLSLDPRPVVLSGPNGAGKTNLLEALSLLGPGRGLRGARLRELDRHGTSGWTISAIVDTPTGPCEITTHRSGNGLRERREINLDGNPVRGQAALAEVINVLWLVPSMDRLFCDRAAARRRFLDRLVYGLDPHHARRLAEYEQALRGRARLLRSGFRDLTWLAALERTMAEKGIAVAASRRATVTRLRRTLAADSGPFPSAGVSLTGQVDDWLDEVPAVDAEARLEECLAASRNRDAETGGAAQGAHKSDLTVRHLAKDLPAESCSTGEQKVLLIAVFLAGARLLADQRGAHPLLLLDDPAAHLDRYHRDALFEAIAGLGGQAWLTGTDRELFLPFGNGAQFLTLQQGVVHRD